MGNSETKRCPHNVVQKGRVPRKISLPTCWRAPDPPVRRTNQNRLIGPSIVPNPQSSTAWKIQWNNPGLIKFANFLNRNLPARVGSVATAQPDIPEGLEGACNQCRHPPVETADLSKRILPL